MQLSGPAAPVSEAVTPSAAAGNIQSMNAHTAALAILVGWYELEHWVAVRNGGEFRHRGVLAPLSGSTIRWHWRFRRIAW